MDPIETVTPEVVETPIVEQAVITENAEPNVEVVETPTEAKPEKTFTQAELDSILTKRLDRERETITKKAAQEARDAVIAEQGHTWNGQPIKTEAEYKQAVKDQATYDALQKQGYPTEAINRLIAVEKSQEETTAKLTEYESKSKQQKDAQAFFEAFPDAKADEIPASVWLEVDKGESLVNAYTRHENQTLRQQLADSTKAKEIEALNAQNAASSTGSVTGQGSVDLSFISADSFENNKGDAGWVKKNFAKIMESRAKW